MKKMGYLVIAIAVLMLAFGSLGLAYATPNAKAQRNQAQNGTCPGGANGAGAQGQYCPSGGNGDGKQVGRGGNCGTGECGLGQQAAPAQAGCPGGACAQ